MKQFNDIIIRCCKELSKKDHAMSGKERFIGTRPQGCPPEIREQWLG
jgi:hypothetical protein